MPKFVIVDHSLISLDGHHYEYCISTAEAAKKKGYEVVILANKRFPAKLQHTDIKISPIFDVDWFGNVPSSKVQTESMNRNFGILETISDLKDTLKLRILLFKKTHPDSIFLLLLEKIQGSQSRFQKWFEEDINTLTNIFKIIPFITTIAGLLKTILAAIRFGIRFFLYLLTSIGIKFYRSINNSLSNLVSLDKENDDLTTSFIRSLSQSLMDLNVKSEDHIFIPTIGIEQIEHLLYFLKTVDPNQSPHYHILQRRDVDEPVVQNAQGIGLKGSLYQFYESGLWPKLVTFYTDTEELTQQHLKLTPVQFITAPIPFRHDKIKHFSKNDYREAIHIVYLGNARPEKGYQYLPNVVKELWYDYIRTGKIRFTIQSNFNLDGGEPGILEARLELEKYPSDKVTLIKNSMEPDNYYELLASADILVIPYQADEYRVRSSGVLAEALAAGKPVVVPQQTWLAKQISLDRGIAYKSPKEISHAIIDIFENFSQFSRNASCYRFTWQEKHSPESLVECLIQDKSISTETISTNPIQDKGSNLVLSTPKSSPTVLLIFEGDRVFHESRLTSLAIKHIEYLTLCNYQVYAVFYSKYHEYRGRLFEHFKYCIREALKPFSITKMWFLDVSPNFMIPNEISSIEYISDVEKGKASLIRDYVELNVFDFSKDLLRTIKLIPFDLIFIDSVCVTGLFNKLVEQSKSSLLGVPIICEASEILSYRYALSNYCDLSQKEFVHEMNLLSRYDAIITSDQKYCEKIIQETKKKQVYSLFLEDKYNDNTKFAFSNIKTARSLTYYLAMNNVLNTLLGEKSLLFNGFEKPKRIAVLYPWNDIHERKSGASLRTGLLIDYLQENSYEVGVFTIDKRQEFWRKKIYYNSYEPSFPHTDLMQNIYIDAYLSWSGSDYFLNQFQNQGYNQKIENNNNTKEELENSWLPWIYYQFRFDTNFEKWLDDITDWADVVILEYPFWGAIAGPMCKQKQKPLILTAHDVLAKQLEINSPLAQIALYEELNAIQQAQEVITLSPLDQLFFEQYGIKSHCVPISLDLKQIQEQQTNVLDLSLSKALGIEENWQKPFCLFVGSKHGPNTIAVETLRKWGELFDLSWDFIVVGNCWEPEKHDNFKSLGKISEETLTRLYLDAFLVVLPLESGTGMSVKTIEAMAYGKVILGTTISFRGYPVESGVNCIICDRLDEYPKKIEQLLQQPEELKLIGQKAKEFAQAYDYRQLYKTYLDLIL